MNQMQKDLLLILPQIIVLLGAVAGLVFEMLRKPRGGMWIITVATIAAVVISITRIDLVDTAFSETFRVGAFKPLGGNYSGNGQHSFSVSCTCRIKRHRTRRNCLQPSHLFGAGSDVACRQRRLYVYCTWNTDDRPGRFCTGSISKNRRFYRRRHEIFYLRFGNRCCDVVRSHLLGRNYRHHPDFRIKQSGPARLGFSCLDLFRCSPEPVMQLQFFHFISGLPIHSREHRYPLLPTFRLHLK